MVRVEANHNDLVILFSKLINLSNIFETHFLEYVLPASSLIEPVVNTAAGVFYWLLEKAKDDRRCSLVRLEFVLLSYRITWTVERTPVHLLLFLKCKSEMFLFIDFFSNSRTDWTPGWIQHLKVMHFIQHGIFQEGGLWDVSEGRCLLKANKLTHVPQCLLTYLWEQCSYHVARAHVK